MDSPTAPSPLDLLRRRQLAAMFAMALGSALLTMVATVVVSATRVESTVVDMAGRQRMLSQLAALHAADLASRVDEAAAEERSEALLSVLDDLETQHRVLTAGDPVAHVRGISDEATLSHYYGTGTSLDRRMRAFLAHGRGLVAGGRTPSIEEAQAFREESARLLPLLESAVQLHRAELEHRADWVPTALFGVFLASLAGLSGLWIFVFRPGLQLFAKEHGRLIAAEARRDVDAAMQRFQRRVTGALELVETERDLLRLVGRASLELGASAPIEVLLSDESESHMVVGATHPQEGGPGCGVRSPWQCPALRRGRTSLFPDSQSLDACPELVDREGSCSAACVPLSFMGDSIGVAHVTFPAGVEPSADYLQRLEFLASASAARLSTLREEFVIVFADADAETAVRVIDRVRIHLANVVSGTDTPTFTASYGISDTRIGRDLTMLIQVADAALLRAKDRGRDRALVADMGKSIARLEPARRDDGEEEAA